MIELLAFCSDLKRLLTGFGLSHFGTKYTNSVCCDLENNQCGKHYLGKQCVNFELFFIALGNAFGQFEKIENYLAQKPFFHRYCSTLDRSNTWLKFASQTVMH